MDLPEFKEEEVGVLVNIIAELQADKVLALIFLMGILVLE